MQTQGTPPAPPLGPRGWRARLATALPVTALLIVSAAGALTASAQTSTVSNLDAIDRYVEAERQAQNIPGIAIGVVQGGEIVHLRGFGTADAAGTPVTPETPFLIGSLTKSFTALAVMQLVEAGKLRLDAPVQHYLPWFRVADADASARITVRYLLHHTSGMPADAGLDAITRGDGDDGVLEWEVRALRTVELSQPVGEVHQYSNANYMVLDLLVQTVSGQTYEAYLREHILDPLNMRQSFTSKDVARAHGLASGHRYLFGVPVPADLPYPRGVLPAGFLIASAEDMARYLAIFQTGGRTADTAILSPAGIADLTRPAVEAGGPDAFYAMGWSVMRDGETEVLGHTGATVDFRSIVTLLPEQELGFVILMNADTPFGKARMGRISEGILDLLVGRQVPTIDASNGPLFLLYGVLLVVVAIQATGIARSVALLRRWRARPARRPTGRWAMAWHVGLPLITNLAWATLTLVLLPRLLGGSLTLMTLQMPDMAYILITSGAVALVWSALRTAMTVTTLRVATPG